MQIALNSRGHAGKNGQNSVFAQILRKLAALPNQQHLMRSKRVWKVVFAGEGMQDAGGGYHESISTMLDELHKMTVPLLLRTPNSEHSAGFNQDTLLFNSASQLKEMFTFLGVLMGIAIRTQSPMDLRLAPPMWRLLVGAPLTLADLSEIAVDYVQGLELIRGLPLDEDLFDNMQLPSATPLSSGREVKLVSGEVLTAQTRDEYVRAALHLRLHEFDQQTTFVRDGLGQVVPLPIVSLLTGEQLELLVCGQSTIDIGALKSNVEYKRCDERTPIIAWMWEVLEEFSSLERSLFLRFVWGRTRLLLIMLKIHQLTTFFKTGLPSTPEAYAGRKFSVTILDTYRQGTREADGALPSSSTCFFALKLPDYSSKAVLKEKLSYAIHFCQNIDADTGARTELDPNLEATQADDNGDDDED